MAETYLHISDEQKSAILNEIQSNVTLVDRNLKILWTNKSAAQSVNKTAVDMIGHTCHNRRDSFHWIMNGLLAM